jgi:hypothetical protein
MLARACVGWGCDVDDVRLAGLDISAVSVVWRRRAEPTKGVSNGATGPRGDGCRLEEKDREVLYGAVKRDRKCDGRWEGKGEAMGSLIVGSSCIPVSVSCRFWFCYSGWLAVRGARPVSGVRTWNLSWVALVLFGLMRWTEMTDDQHGQGMRKGS